MNDAVISAKVNPAITRNSFKLTKVLSPSLPFKNKNTQKCSLFARRKFLKSDYFQQKYHNSCKNGLNCMKLSVYS